MRAKTKVAKPPTMTLAVFLRRLRKAPVGTSTWYFRHGLFADSMIRAQGQTTDGMLEEWCPITAVADKPNELGDAEPIGRKLGLNLKLTRAIIQAADYEPGHDPKLRAKLLKAVGLKEPTQHD